MKTRRFDFDFRPLAITSSVSVEGSVPGRQTYDANTDTYVPDYTLAPLVIQPRVSAMDADGMVASGPVNGALANVHWYENIGGKRTLIDSSNPGYEVVTTGADAGRIRVKKNAQPRVQITLELEADYADPRGIQVYKIRQSYAIRCGNATQAVPRLELDAADQSVYNPLRAASAEQTVHAKLMMGTEECPAQQRIFVWEIFREDTQTWSTVGSDTVLDYDAEVSTDGTSCKVDKSLMGERMLLRCRAKYLPAGDDGVSENLLPGTQSWLGWTPGSGAEIEPKAFDGLDVVHMDNTAGTASVWATRLADYTFKKSQIYTLSFWAKGTGTVSTAFSNGSLRTCETLINKDGVVLAPDITNSTGSANYSLTTEWVRHFVVFKSTSGDASIGFSVFFYATAGADVRICGAKLEEGENLSPVWSQSAMNLLRKSKEMPMQNWPEHSGAASTTTGSDGFAVVSLSRSQASSSSPSMSSNMTVMASTAMKDLCKKGRRYTFSFDYKCPVPSDVRLTLRLNSSTHPNLTVRNHLWVTPEKNTLPASTSWKRASMSRVFRDGESENLISTTKYYGGSPNVTKLGLGVALGQGTGTYFVLGCRPDLAIHAVDKLTFSFQCSGLATGETASGSFRGVSQNAVIGFQAKNGLNVVTFTGKEITPESGGKLIFAYASAADGTSTVQLTDFKLEKGENAAPAWSPSEEEEADYSELCLGVYLDSSAAVGDAVKIRKLCLVEGSGTAWTQAATELPADELLDDSAPEKTVAFVRRIPKYEYDMTGVPENIPPGIEEIKPEAVVWDSMGTLDHPEKELQALWYLAENKAANSLDYSLVGHGYAPVIGTEKIGGEHGGVLALDVVDTGGAVALTDSDGAVLTDSDGAVLVAKVG